MTEERGDRARWWLFGALAAVVVVVGVAPDLRPGADNWDAQVKTEAAWNMLHGRGPILTSAPAAFYLTPGSDGRTYAPYPFFAYVLQVPSALTALWLERPYEGLAPLILLALTAAVLVATARHLGASLPAAVAGALLACLGTALRPMVGVGHDNGIEVLALAVALWAAAVDRPAAFAWAGLATGLALATRIGAVPLLVPAAVLVLAKRPWSLRDVVKRGVAFSVGCVPGFAMILGFNLYRFGTPFEVQAGSSATARFVPWLSAAHWDGILGLTVSPGKGLLWYSPVLIAVLLLAVPVARRFPLVLGALGAYLVVAVVFYGRLTFWHGDWGWGPRYVAPAFLAAAPLAWWGLDVLRPSRAVHAAIAAGAFALMTPQAWPNAVYPIGYYLGEAQERAAAEGRPAPTIVSPTLENADYFYFRLETSPILVVGRGYAASLGEDHPDEMGRYLADQVRRTLWWSLVAPGLSLALVHAANRRAGPGTRLQGAP